MTIVLFEAVFSSAEDNELRHKAESIWKTAEEVSTLDTQGTQAYKEAGTFTLSGLIKGSVKGNYIKELVDAQNWAQDLKVGDFEIAVIHKGDKLYKHENAEFTPVRVEQFISMLPPFKLEPRKNERVLKIRSLKIRGLEATCVDSEIDSSVEPQKRVTCVSAKDGNLLSVSDPHQQISYSGFVLFQGKQLPTHLELVEFGRKVLDADLTYAEQPTLKGTTIQVPEGWQPEPQCNNRIPPEVESRPHPPDVPELHSLDRTFVIGVLVGKDGLVRKATVIESGDPSFDKLIEESVGKWHFKPSLCDGVPVEAKMNVAINYSRFGN